MREVFRVSRVFYGCSFLQHKFRSWPCRCRIVSNQAVNRARPAVGICTDEGAAVCVYTVRKDERLFGVENLYRREVYRCVQVSSTVNSTRMRTTACVHWCAFLVTSIRTCYGVALMEVACNGWQIVRK